LDTQEDGSFPGLRLTMSDGTQSPMLGDPDYLILGDDDNLMLGDPD